MNERDRALAAEDAADTNAAIAARRLADSLMAQGTQHLNEERHPETEVLAAHAYQMVGSPEAMGLLMASLDTDGLRAEAIARLPLHCTRLELSGRGDKALCGTPDLVETYLLKANLAPKRSWAKRASHVHAIWGPTIEPNQAETLVTLVLDERRVALLDANTGSIIAGRTSRRFVIASDATPDSAANNPSAKPEPDERDRLTSAQTRHDEAVNTTIPRATARGNEANKYNNLLESGGTSDGTFFETSGRLDIRPNPIR